jgi:hypothetical protein
MFAAVGALSLAGSTAASAQTTGTHTVTFEVQKINVISASGAASLTITTAVPGSAPTQATAVGTPTYSVSSNDAGSKITIGLGTGNDMPTGVTLTATLAAPSGATSVARALSATDQDAVTGITTVVGSNLAVTYTLDATIAAGIIASATRTVTLTIVAGT